MPRTIEIVLYDGTEFRGELPDALRALIDQAAPTTAVEARVAFVNILFEVFMQGGWTPPGQDTSEMMRHDFLADFREGESLYEVTFKFNESQRDGRSPKERGILARANSADEVAGRLTYCLCQVDAVMILGLEENFQPEYKPVPKTVGVMKKWLVGFEVALKGDDGSDS